MFRGHNPFGERGEIHALKYLEKQGYKLVKHNYSCKIGEIDLILKHGEIYIFAEIKTRSSEKFGRPSEAVTPHKQNKIRQVATAFMMEQKCYPSPCRFDIVEVLDGAINHIKNAF